MIRKLTITAAFLAIFTFGCDKGSDGPAPASSGSGASAGSAALPAGLRLVSAPEGAKDVASAKTGLKDGDRVVVRGVVAGRTDPIAPNRAILTLLDPAIPTCDRNPADKCETPWDACCEPQDEISKGSITVQVVDAQGNPMRSSLSTVAGIKPLAELVVTGTARVDATGGVHIDADGIFVAK